MDTKQFLNTLREVIRKEVRQAVREELRSVLAESKQAASASNTKPGLLAQVLGFKHNIQGARTPRPAPTTTKRFQIPGLIGDLLNETAMSMASGQGHIPDEQEGWLTMGGEDFTADRVPPSSGAIPQPPHPHPSGDPTMAFIKDYSAVVKKAEEITNGKYQ